MDGWVDEWMEGWMDNGFVGLYFTEPVFNKGTSML